MYLPPASEETVVVVEMDLGDEGLAPRVVGVEVGFEAPDGANTGRTRGVERSHLDTNPMVSLRYW